MLHVGLVGRLGGGPWMVLEGCPAPRHNTLRAARGQQLVGREKRVGFPRCVCPRGAGLMRGDYDRRNERQRVGARVARRASTQRGGQQRRGEVRAATAATQARQGSVPASYITNVKDGSQPPDLRGAACQTPGGRKVMDAGAFARRGSELSRQAVRICDSCPLEVKQRCRDWAVQGENPPGSWDGIYGGLTSFDRRKLAGLPTSKG